MLYYLSLLTHTDQLAFFRLFGYLSFRAMAAVVTALIIAFWINPMLIRWLKLKQGKGQPIRSDGPARHILEKAGTPTMGGLLILIPWIGSTLIWASLSNRYVWIVLMVTAARMVEVHNVRAILDATRSDAAVLVLTAVATIAFDLILAVEIGIAVAAVLALRKVAQTMTAVAEPVRLEELPSEDLLHEGIIAYRLDGALFFGAAQRFLTELTAVSDARVAILRLPDLQVLDATAHRLGPRLTGADSSPVVIGSQVWALDSGRGRLTTYDVKSLKQVQSVPVGADVPVFASPSTGAGRPDQCCR